MSPSTLLPLAFARSALIPTISTKKKPKEPLDPKNYERDLELSRNQHTFRWNSLHSYSVAAGFGYGRQNINSQKGFEHHGLVASLAAGLRIPQGLWRRHVVLPRFFYQYQGHNDFRIGKSYLSHAATHRVGIEVNYLIEAVPTWLQVGAAFGFGLAVYRTRKGDFSGVFLNDDFRLRQVNSKGSHFNVGAQACTFNGLVCLKSSFNFDLGMRSEMEGLNSQGVSFQLLVDAMRFFHVPTPRAVAKKYRQIPESSPPRSRRASSVD